MKTNFKQFLKEYRKNQQTVLNASGKIVTSVLEEMYKRVVDRTPVGDPSLWNYPVQADYKPGTLKDSWNLRFSINTDTAGIRSVSGGSIKFQVASNKRTGATIFNNQPYAQRVEHGWSTQAPKGMLRITVAEYEDIVRAKTVRYRIK
jgi:hypothetical protein